MSTQREEIVVRAGFDNTQLNRDLRSTGDNIKNWAGNVGKALIGAFAVEKIFDFGKGLLELGKSISLTAERLGVTTAQVQKLQYAGAMTGVQLDTIAGALDRLARAKEKVLNQDAGSQKLLESFNRFGITIADIEKMAPVELFDKISESVSKTGTNASVTADAMDLFGKSGGKLIPLLAEFRAQSQNAPIISDDDLQNIRDASEELEGLNMQLKAIAATMLVRIFQKKTWQEFWYSVSHPDTQADDIAAQFNDPEKIGDPAKKAAYYRAHPEMNPASPKSSTDDDSEAEGSGGKGSSSGAGSSLKDVADLYQRRAVLARQIRDVHGNSYSTFLEKAAELKGIQDEIDLKNAPDEQSRLKVQQSQARRDLRTEQVKLPIGDEARAAEKVKVQNLADRLGGINSQILDYTKSPMKTLADHMEKQSTTLEKISGVVQNGAMIVRIPSD